MGLAGARGRRADRRAWPKTRRLRCGREPAATRGHGASGHAVEKGEGERFWGTDVLGNLAVSLEIPGFLGVRRQECPKQLRTSKPQLGKAAKKERGEEEDQGIGRSVHRPETE